MITVRAAAMKTGVSKSLLYQLIRAGRLRCYRIGIRGKGRILLDEKDLETFVASCLVDGNGQGSDDGEEELTFLK